MALRELDDARDRRVLERAVHGGLGLENGCDGEDHRGRDLEVQHINGRKERVSGVVHAGGDALRVRGSEDDGAVEPVLSLEAAHVHAELLEVGLLVRAGGDVVRIGLLVRGNELSVIEHDSISGAPSRLC